MDFYFDPCVPFRFSPVHCDSKHNSREKQRLDMNASAVNVARVAQFGLFNSGGAGDTISTKPKDIKKVKPRRDDLRVSIPHLPFGEPEIVFAYTLEQIEEMTRGQAGIASDLAKKEGSVVVILPVPDSKHFVF